MSANYNAAAWYWLPKNASPSTPVFSAPKPGYVAATDAGYEAFIASGLAATNILSDGELSDVLCKAKVPLPVLQAAGFTSWGNVPPQDIFNVFLALGVAITSTSTPALDGTYALDTTTQQSIQAISIYITINNAFPNNASALPWYDANGNLHSFASTTEFKAFATAVANYVAILNLTLAALQANASASWPTSNAVTIA